MPVLAGPVAGVTVTVISTETPVYVEAGFANPRAVSGVPPGDTAQAASAVAELCGTGAAALKSDELLSVSVHTFVRTAAVVFESVAVGLPSEQVAALPKPTRSIRLGLVVIVGHPVNAVVVFASATFPAVALNASEPVASGVGRFVVPADPADSCTNRYCPGCSVNVGSAVTCHDVPVELAYCTLQPATDTGAAV